MKTKIATGLVLGFFLIVNAFGAERPSGVTSNTKPATITVRVQDYTHAKPGPLLQAERTAAAILLRAGVEAVWLPGRNDGRSPTTACASDPTHLILRILPNSMAKQWRSVHGDALGFAGLGTHLSCDAW